MPIDYDLKEKFNEEIYQTIVEKGNFVLFLQQESQPMNCYVYNFNISDRPIDIYLPWNIIEIRNALAYKDIAYAILREGSPGFFTGILYYELDNIDYISSKCPFQTVQEIPKIYPELFPSEYEKALKAIKIMELWQTIKDKIILIISFDYPIPKELEFLKKNKNFAICQYSDKIQTVCHEENKPFYVINISKYPNGEIREINILKNGLFDIKPIIKKYTIKEKEKMIDFLMKGV